MLIGSMKKDVWKNKVMKMAMYENKIKKEFLQKWG